MGKQRDLITEQALSIVTWAYESWREYMRVFTKRGFSAVDNVLRQEAIRVEARLEEIRDACWDLVNQSGAPKTSRAYARMRTWDNIASSKGDLTFGDLLDTLACVIETYYERQEAEE